MRKHPAIYRTTAVAFYMQCHGFSKPNYKSLLLEVRKLVHTLNTPQKKSSDSDLHHLNIKNKITRLRKSAAFLNNGELEMVNAPSQCIILKWLITQ